MEFHLEHILFCILSNAFARLMCQRACGMMVVQDRRDLHAVNKQTQINQNK